MTTLEKIKNEIASAINKVLKQNVVTAGDLIYPPKPEFGDLSLACYKIAKNFNKSAVEMAEFLVGKVQADGIISGSKAVGPYFNLVLAKNKLSEAVIKEILNNQSDYGYNKKGKNKKVMIEYSNANTHKEYHVGHLRNITYGDAVAKILAANGFKVMPVSYINDFGIHVAKTLWALEKYRNNEKSPLPPSASSSLRRDGFVKGGISGKSPLTPLDKGGKNKGYFLGKVYVKACQELEKSETAKAEAAEIMKKIKARAGKEYKLWQKTRKWSIDGFAKIYKELGVKFDHIFYENEFLERGMEIVADLYKKEFLKKSEGAIIADLSQYGLGFLVILRSDGTALYPVADLPLAMEKFKKYKINSSIYVVDIRQSLYFKQLFKVLELLGFKQETRHLSYEFVKLPEGMMSSRTGQVITYEELRVEARERATRETKTRHKNWSKTKLSETVEKIVNGALKFEMIKVNAEKIITFDIDQALKFEGYTAAYLQYTYARINSIKKKARKQENKKTKKEKFEIKNLKFGNLTEQQESVLANKLARYPEIVEQAGRNFDPAEIAKYLFELAQEFNDYYHSVPVLKAPVEIKKARLALITAVSQVIKNGLALLGIEVVEEM